MNADLYRFDTSPPRFWRYHVDAGAIHIESGEVGQPVRSETLPLDEEGQSQIAAEIEARRAEGFRELEPSDNLGAIVARVSSETVDDADMFSVDATHVWLHRYGAAREYWEYWTEGDGTVTLHYGRLGTLGMAETIEPDGAESALVAVQRIERLMRADGYAEIDEGALEPVTIQYALDSRWGREEDLQKRNSVEDRLNEAMRWHGLGRLAGGRMGGGRMEATFLVVDADLARKVIVNDLSGTDLADYRGIVIPGDED